MKKILVVIFVIVGLYFLYQWIALQGALEKASKNLEGYPVKTIDLSYGQMTYLDNGLENEEIILSIHGLYGGYDQAYATVKDFEEDYRLIAPSRFGYLGSSVKGHGTPKDQAEAYLELLDLLNIDKVYLLATSAGGTPALRLALDHPDRVKGVILYCSAIPAAEKPEEVGDLMGPPEPLNNDYIMWLLSPFFPSILGMDSATIYSMLPISQRKVGANLDARITNRDMLVNYDEYPIEDLQVPVLLLHAKDDKTAKYEDVEKSIHRYPDLTSCIFDSGGHLMVGHGDEIHQAVEDFTDKNK